MPLLCTVPPTPVSVGVGLGCASTKTNRWPQLRPKGKKRVGAEGEGWVGFELCRGQPIVAAAKHGGREARHDGLGLDMEVAVELIGAPTPYKPNAIAADPGAD